MPTDSRIVSWGVQSIGSGDVDYWQGTLAVDFVDDAVQSLVDYLG